MSTPDLPMRERIAEALAAAWALYSTRKVLTQIMVNPSTKASAEATSSAQRGAGDVIEPISPYRPSRPGKTLDTSTRVSGTTLTLNMAMRVDGTSQPTNHAHSQTATSPARTQLKTRSEKTFGTRQPYGHRRRGMHLTAAWADEKEARG